MDIYTAGDRTPYTYIITHLPTGKRYYGSRYSYQCKPTDLWIKYFTSSQVVRDLIKQDGVNAFSIEIRKTFTTVKECRSWESRFLHKIDARFNDKWLNAHNGGSDFYNVSLASDITKQRMSEVRLGKPKSESMKQNSMWYYELKFANGVIEYVKGKRNVLTRLGRKDWETIRVCIQRNNGFVPRAGVFVKRLPKSFCP
jgi:hypothetical protein